MRGMDCNFILISIWVDGTSLVAQMIKHLPAMQEAGFDPWARKIPWRMEWQPTVVFLPGESMDRGAWWATVHGITKSQTQLKRHLLFLSCYPWSQPWSQSQFWYLRLMDECLLGGLLLEDNSEDMYY